jgi:hypothetical protein
MEMLSCELSSLLLLDEPPEVFSIRIREAQLTIVVRPNARSELSFAIEMQ